MKKEPSKIKQAQPKQGLKTGSVEGAKGGLISGREKVAMEYAAALSGAEGPVAQFDAVDEIAGIRAREAIDGLSFSSPGGTNIFGSDGNFVVVSPRRPQSVAAAKEQEPKIGRWDLVPNEQGDYNLHAPLLIASLSALGTPITITNSPITLQADRWVVLECDDVTADPLSFTLALRSETAGEMEAYTFDGDDELTAAYLPLWRIAATESPGSVPLGEDLHGTCYVGPGALSLASWAINIPDTAKFTYVPRLAPL